MSQDNIPVHDYEPSAADLIRLQASDVFFYHGLGLEPWVDSTISSLGDDAPTSIGTHAMPGDEVTLDYEGMLVTELCELLTAGPYESTTLAMDEDDASEIHAEYVAHTLSFPDMDDDHDDHGDEDDDHDDHGDDDHDDHDDHSDHGHASPEETIENPAGCPADSVISIFHMEEGEYILEFEEAEDLHEFNMAVLKMGGGHAHHHHGHGSGPFEWAGIFSISDASHTWTMEKVDGSYADPSMRVVIIPTDTPTEETMHSLEGGVEALIEGDCTIVEDGESMTPVDGGSCFEWHVGTGDISTFTIDTSGMSGFAAYTAHSPYEFEATQHYLKDSAGNDVEHVAEEGGGGHGDHGDHGDDDHDDDGDDHDDHDEEMTPEHAMEEFDSNSDSHISWDEFVGMMESMDDDHDDHDDHGDEEHDEFEVVFYHMNGCSMCESIMPEWDSFVEDNPDITTRKVESGESEASEMNIASYPTILMLDDGQMVAEFDEDYNAENLEHFYEEHAEHEEDGHDDHDDDMVCYDMSTHTVDASYTTESDCEAAGLMWTAANSGPGGDDHDDHAEEALNYDPHSWLDPVAFEAQLSIVMEGLIAAFPSAEDDFRANAGDFSSQLTAMDDAYEAAFGENGTCAAGGHEKTVAANHNAYSYIAVRYDIQFVTVHGLDPEGEPSPEDIAKVVEHINEEGITVLFVEEYTDPSSVGSIVQETGVTIEYLYTMEMAPIDSNDDYLSLMNKNLDNLVDGMGC